MKTLVKEQVYDIPDGVTITVKARTVTVKGPRGTNVVNVKHMPIDLTMINDNRSVKIERWFTSGKSAASIRTCYSHIANAVIGVTQVRARARSSPPARSRWPGPQTLCCLLRQGFLYKMRFVYAHFPINVAISKDATEVQIRNFLGEKVVRVVKCLGDVTVQRSTDVKDEITVRGNDIDAVSRTWCAAPPCTQQLRVAPCGRAHTPCTRAPVARVLAAAPSPRAPSPDAPAPTAHSWRPPPVRCAPAAR
jgi:large subunit ribosomal protein L9e